MTSSSFDDEIAAGQGAALVIHPHVSGAALGGAEHKAWPQRDKDAMIEEICGLVRAIDLKVASVEVFNLSQIQAGHFLGKGQREKIAALVEEFEPEIVVVNHALSPVQQRNLERDFDAKVIDRTGLILEIFGARAQTKEGRLQVDLAALEYQRSRLVRSWTHLERQRGGAGFMGGPGERQIELDRRIIDQKIVKLKKELETVKRTRELGRKARAKVPFPIVALVGYTNAGKSTLFNTLTQSKVFAKDLLFATLDPTLRKLELPSGYQVILSDTVGFISDLPTHLIAAFRATLEETLHADVILHVCDASSEAFEAQYEDVVEILGGLGISYDNDERIIEAFNKMDLLDGDALSDIARKARYSDRSVMISAIDGRGVDELLGQVEEKISQGFYELEYRIPYADGKAISWLYERGEVHSREGEEADALIEVRLSVADMARFYDKFGYEAENPEGERQSG